MLIKETLINSSRLRIDQCFGIKARLCRRIENTSKSRNAETGTLANPRRAGPAAPICGVAVLAKATSLRLRTAPCI